MQCPETLKTAHRHRPHFRRFSWSCDVCMLRLHDALRSRLSGVKGDLSPEYEVQFERCLEELEKEAGTVDGFRLSFGRKRLSLDVS